MTNDERLKDILIQKSRNGYAIISVFNPDTTVKNRRNGRKARKLQELVIEAGFSFKPFSKTLSNGEVKTDFLVFDKFDDGFNETGIRLETFIENCKENLTHFTVQYDLEEYLKDKEFYHPLLKSEKDEYITRKEIILLDLFEPPEHIGGWLVKKALSETHVVYGSNETLCIISLLPDGTWQRSIGKIKPIGVLIKKEILNSQEEAFSKQIELKA